MQMKTLTSLMALLCFTPLTMEECAEEQDACGGPLSTTPFDDLVQSTNYFCRCTFPTYKLSVDCILSSCPELREVCPLSGGCVDQTALTKAVSILNTCLGQGGSICDIDMTSTPMVPLGWTTQQILPTSVANGTCWLNPGTGFLNDLSSAQYTVCPAYSTNGLINLSIQTDKIANKANYNCTFNLPSNSFLQPLTSMFPSLTSLNPQNVTGYVYFNVSITVSIDLSTQPPTIKTLDDQSHYSVAYTNLVTPTGICVPTDIEQTFTDGINKIIQLTDITSSATTLLSTFAALSLQAAQQNCP